MMYVFSILKKNSMYYVPAYAVYDRELRTYLADKMRGFTEADYDALIEYGKVHFTLADKNSRTSYRIDWVPTYYQHDRD